MQQISKNQIKFIRSLSQLKFRKEHHSYIVEGVKNAEEWLQQNADIASIVATEAWLSTHSNLIKNYNIEKYLIATAADFEKISGFKTPNEVLLVVNIPEQQPVSEIAPNEWILILDRVQDPGNFGTIIRTADWFGIQNIICSPDCVEQYNPKVIQSTMGSLLRVNCIYTDLLPFLEKFKNNSSYAAVLGGGELDTSVSYAPGFIIMGNESKGISDAVQSKVQHRLTIPRIGGAEIPECSGGYGYFLPCINPEISLIL